MRIRIQTKLALLFSVATALFVLVVTVVQFVETRQAAISVLRASQYALVTGRAEAMDEAIELRRRVLERAAQTAVVEGAFRNAQSAREYLKVHNTLNAPFGDLFILSRDGIVLADLPMLPGRVGISLADRDYLRQVKEQRHVVISDPISSRTQNRPTVVFAAGAWSANGEYLGALIGAIDLERSDLTHGVAMQRIGNSGYFYLVATRPVPTMVSHPKSERIMRPLSDPISPLLTRAIAGWDGAEAGTNASGLSGLFSFRHLKSTGWILAAVFPAEEAFAPIERAQWRIAAIGLAAALLCGLATWLLLTRYLRPLQTMRDEIRLAIDEPDHTPRLPIRRRDEIGGVSRDLTELIEQRAKYQRQLVALNSDLDSSVSMKTRDLRAQVEEMESFLHTLGHDLRAPIRAVSGFTDIVLKKEAGAIGTESKRLLQRVAENGRYMGHMVDGMIELGRLSAKKLTGVELTTVDSRGILDDLFRRMATPEHMQIFIGELAPAMGNERLLTDVWRALIENAVKFTALSASPKIEISCAVQGEEVIYSVRDNGAGFDMAYVDALFKPFSRLQQDAAPDGKGMGLAVAQRSVSLMGGRIWAEGEPGKGAAFHFALHKLA